MTLATRAPTTGSETLTDFVLRRIAELRFQNQDLVPMRTRIRAIMNGGPHGLRALIGPSVKLRDQDVPAANLMLSGMERAAQALQDAPDLRMPVPDADTSQAEKDRMLKRHRIVKMYDDLDRLELQIPQVARWIQGYGFAVWTIRERIGPEGKSYPRAELRDPFECWPGYWGVDQQPSEAAFVRYVPAQDLARVYPQHADKILSDTPQGWQKTAAGGYILNPNGRQWEGSGHGVEVVEYVNERGTFVAFPQLELVVDFIPNPLTSGPPFVFVKRFSFDKLIGQFDHVLGLMAMMAKLNVLAVIQATDAVFQETNIIGDMISKKYKRGRDAVNFFTPGTRIEKGSAQIAFQVFQEIDRLERQLRITENYPVAADGISPMSFTTGEGVRELQSASGAMTKEYQKALRWGVQDVDSKRLEWDEQCYPNEDKPLRVRIDGKEIETTYRPSRDIKGRWTTRRWYGLMASWDEPSKIVGGLQLLTGEVIDTETMQYNLSGLDDIPEINKRLGKQKGLEQLYQLLLARAAPQGPGLPGDPTAEAALVEISLTGEVERVLEKFFRPESEGENPSPEEQAMLQQQQLQQLVGGGAAAEPGLGGPPPPVQTVLSQLGGGGAVEGGAQIVART